MKAGELEAVEGATWPLADQRTNIYLDMEAFSGIDTVDLAGRSLSQIVAEQYYMSACIECGCCSYVCPANIEITGYIKTGKIFVARQKKKVPG